MLSVFVHLEITKVQLEIMKSWKEDGGTDEPGAVLYGKSGELRLTSTSSSSPP